MFKSIYKKEEKVLKLPYIGIRLDKFGHKLNWYRKFKIIFGGKLSQEGVEYNERVAADGRHGPWGDIGKSRKLSNASNSEGA